MTSPRQRRVAAAAAVATGLLAAFAAFGGVGIAQSAISSAQYQYGTKVTICHKGKTISVGKAAEPAHVRHGDAVGTCAAAAKAKKAKAAKAKAAKAAAAKAKAEQKQDDSSDTPGKGNGHGKGGKG